MTATRSAVVIGAGITGLACALRLQARLLQSKKAAYNVIIVAKEFPNTLFSASSASYASMWAGAHVRPIPASDPQLSREAEWLKFTTEVLRNQAQEAPWAGITTLPAEERIGVADKEYRARYTSARAFRKETGLSGWKDLGTRGSATGIKLAFSYDSFCINSPVYCMYLLRKFILGGGKTVEMSLASEWEAFRVAENVDFVVNASGTGFGDPNCFPTKGQTCLVANACSKTITQQNPDGTWTFIIPRGYDGGTVIGGTKVPHDWTTEPSLQTRKTLLENAAKMYPAILNERGEFDVVADIVGRRPTRTGGMRLEIERRKSQSQEAQAVIHAYGAGGRGYEISWGVAEEVLKLAETLWEVPTPTARL